MLRLCLVAGLVGLVACSSLAEMPYPLAEHYQTGDTFMQVRLCGTLRISPQSVDGLKVTELSALAWDEDEQLLYALSDQGSLYHIQVTLENQRLTHATVIKALPLSDKQGKPLTGKQRDSEGLMVRNANNGKHGDSELVVAFEILPRLARFSPQGRYLGAESLPLVLRNIKNYRSKNKSLESIAEHPQEGLLTAPESALRDIAQNHIRLYAQHRFWQWEAYPAPNSFVVALEMLDAQRLLVMERAFSSVFQPLIISLREVQLHEACVDGKQTCVVKNLAIFDNSQGWAIDNFEGLTRQQGNFFFMVSDDNDSPWQQTLLSYFELLDN